jgi:Cu/Ag efflux pump CusA
MWLVRVALERPYTFVVLALLVLIMSAVAISTTPTDIFPNINIPVVAVDWTYTGLNPEELEGRLTSEPSMSSPAFARFSPVRSRHCPGSSPSRHSEISPSS